MQNGKNAKDEDSHHGYSKTFFFILNRQNNIKPAACSLTSSFFKTFTHLFKDAGPKGCLTNVYNVIHKQTNLILRSSKTNYLTDLLFFIQHRILQLSLAGRLFLKSSRLFCRIAKKSVVKQKFVLHFVSFKLNLKSDRFISQNSLYKFAD